ncbi:GntR family transcriptional regulator [Paenibacillaceae bacterium]|nr:GntR family transcriptional regulator [Paenibacillaceae bacterium]
MPIPSNYAKPIRTSAKDRAFSQLQRWITDGTLEPGEKLTDAELAEALGVSRTPIREALQLLEMQGLVEMHPGVDTRVKKIEKNDILKLYPTMAVLHGLAAEAAATIIISEQIEQLAAINMQFAKAIEAGQPYQAMEADELFHNMIVDIANNSYLSSFSASLQIHIRRFKYVFLKRPVNATEASVQEHADMLAAFERRDHEAAAAIMKQNLLRPMNELYETIEL